MKQNNTSKKRSGMPRLLILLALALFLIAYLTVPAVSRPLNQAAAVLGSANVDAVVEYIRSFGAYAMVFSFFLPAKEQGGLLIFQIQNCYDQAGCCQNYHEFLICTHKHHPSCQDSGRMACTPSRLPG